MTNTFERYAVYFAPRQDTELFRFGNGWLYGDGNSGIRNAQWIESPARYGFHATLKAPMRLNENATFESFQSSVVDMSKRLCRVNLGILRLSQIGNFLALTAEEPRQAMVSNLAWDIVTELDHLRAPLNDKERNKRGDLSTAEQDNLERWGYPYVGRSFQFHMTLTSQLNEEDLAATKAILEPMIPRKPASIDTVCIFGDPGAAKRFELVERFDLKGEVPQQ